MSDVRTIVFIGHCPIPVGNEVHVVYFDRVSSRRALFGGHKKSRQHLDTPLITDLGTGVVYGHLAHYSSKNSLQGGRINAGEQRLEAGLEERERIEGEVVACRIAAIGFEGWSAPSLEQYETVLEVRPR